MAGDGEATQLDEMRELNRRETKEAEEAIGSVIPAGNILVVRCAGTLYVQEGVWVRVEPGGGLPCILLGRPALVVSARRRRGWRGLRIGRCGRRAAGGSKNVQKEFWLLA